MTIAYPYNNNLYLNITNRCPIACVFCIRHNANFHLGKYDLRLPLEPSLKEIKNAALPFLHDNPHEVVFCGIGEPLMRPDAVLEVATWLGQYNTPVRIDTCGLANLVHGRDLTPELSKVVPSISISLNASNARDYAAVCPSPYGEAAFDALLDFIKLAKERFTSVTLSAVHPNAYTHLGVSCPIDIDACQRLAQTLALPLRVRGK